MATINISIPEARFRDYCAGYLMTHKGFRAVRTPPYNDYHGADLIGTDGRGRLWVIKCKVYADSPDNAAVQEVIAAKAHYGASCGGVITNTDLSKWGMRLHEVGV